MKKHYIITLLALAVSSTLTACSSNNAPNELEVSEGGSLSLPPNFDLRPPMSTDEAELIAARDNQNEVRNLVLGGEKGQSGGSNSSENWLIKQAGGENRDPNIRERLQSDAKTEKANDEEKKNFLSKIFSRKEGE